MARIEFQAALGRIIQKFFFCWKKPFFDYKSQKNSGFRGRFGDEPA
jgi:hypothetical protein